MAFTLPDLGVPTFDAQAVRDSTDDAIIAAAARGYGVAVGSEACVSPNTGTGVNTTASTPLTNFVGGQNITSTGISVLNFPSGGGYFSAPSSGGGTAFFGFTGVSGSTLQNVTYISGGSGNLNNGVTLTSIMAVVVASGTHVENQYVDVVVASGFAAVVSIPQIGGTPWTALPASSGDRKDMVVTAGPTGTVTIVAGSPVSQLDWSRANGTLTNAAPNKAAWVSATPIVLAEVYIPGVGSTHGTNGVISAAQITDKTIVVTLNDINSNGPLGANVTLTTSATDFVVQTSTSLAIGTYEVSAVLQIANTGASLAHCEARLVTSASGGATFTGNAGGETDVAAAGNGQLVLLGEVTVSAAGTIDVRARTSLTGSAVIIEKSTPTTAFVNATSFRFRRVGT